MSYKAHPTLKDVSEYLKHALTEQPDDEHPTYDEQDRVKEIWAVLAAMRGPDDCNNAVKYRTTEKIRMAFIGRVCPCLTNGEPYNPLDAREIQNHHFKTHVQDAANALIAHGMMKTTSSKLENTSPTFTTKAA